MLKEIELIRDNWLSKFFKHDAYNLIVKSPENIKKSNSEEEVQSLLRGKAAFIYTKIPVRALRFIHILEKIGFRLVETSVKFEKNIDSEQPLNDLVNIRIAKPEDRQGVRRVAWENFNFSRFHLDYRIPDSIANKIKEEWASNYFLGKRGDAMIVSETEGRISGFLQLIHSEKTLLIDLIAVDVAIRRKKVARNMIAFAEKSFDGFNKIKVGTQLANAASIQFYQNLGFHAIEAQYIFHYHSHG